MYIVTYFDIVDNYLSSAQSAPNLPGATTTSMPTSASTVLTSTLSSALATSLTSTSSESDNEFLEPCPTSSLMAELEDEEFPEPEDLDDENEDDSDGEDYDDGTVRVHLMWYDDLITSYECIFLLFTTTY